MKKVDMSEAAILRRLKTVDQLRELCLSLMKAKKDSDAKAELKKMNKQITIPFQVTLWDVKPYDEPADAPVLSRGTVKKTFSGEIKGESTGEILMCSSADGSAAYTIIERVTGELCGRTGTFVLMHGATHTPQETSRAIGKIVPNSGTGELRGISGTIEFISDENGKNIILDFTLEDV